jgi:hypothetical protein
MNRLLWYCFWAPLYHLITLVMVVFAVSGWPEPY